jgi:UDPglucose 6-dehydrogenase
VIPESNAEEAAPTLNGRAVHAPITVYGAGYVGLVTAACLAELMHDVVCMDTDATRVAQLNRGCLPFHEPGLEDLIVRNGRRGRLMFTTDPNRAVAHGAIQFIAVGTPCSWDGAADIGHVLSVARQIGARLQHDAVIVCKSTSPVGTAERVHQIVQAELTRRHARKLAFSVVANPEFLREGTAVEDFMQPDRIVVGVDDAHALQAMRTLYAPLLRQASQWLPMTVRAAELTKYACNAMLAARISVMNDFALLAECLHVNIDEVRKGMASDPRIGPRFLAAGCGFGGSCLPKDLRALQHTAMEHGVLLPTLAAVEQTNARQKALLARRLVDLFGGSLSGKRVALWGLAFKPGTDDLRDAPSETLIAALVTAGARVVAHDPVAMPAAQRRHGHLAALSFAVDPLDAVEQADALVIATDWPQYAASDWQQVRQRMAQPYVMDGRNLCDPERMVELGFHYQGIGRGHFEKVAATPSTPAVRSVAADRLPAPSLTLQSAVSAALRP